MNLDKTELYPINLSTPDATEMAQIFRCHLSTFPFKYLGVPLHKKKLTVHDWGFLVDKVGNKLQNWKGQLLSLGGRITLVNAVLSAVPLYAMSLYHVPKTIIAQLDRIRHFILMEIPFLLVFSLMFAPLSRHVGMNFIFWLLC